MNYFITGGTGFIGTHLTNLLQELHPECNVYNLDIVEPGTPLPSVEDYKPALRKGQKLASTFIRCDVRKPIVLEGVNVTADDVIFNLLPYIVLRDILIMPTLKQMFLVQRM